MADGSAPAMAACTTPRDASGGGRPRPTWRYPSTSSPPTSKFGSAEERPMAIGLHKSEFTNPVVRWIDARMPVFTMMQKEYGTFPTPRNFNYFWNFGALAM